MKKILIIEDETSIAELEKDYLEISNFQVEIESSGDIGLQKAKTKNYDLIIVDIMLPEVSGFEICKEIRKTQNIPIIMVSAKKEDIDKIRGLGLGADDYITKPFSPGELVARVKAHLIRYERLVGSSFREKQELIVNGLRIDKSSRRVYVDENEVFLTGKEFDLLQLLVENSNRVFTKNELFDKVWGIDSTGDIATVTVHVRKLREKIEKEPSNPEYIETVWGVGYRLKP
ncbi:response regulator transcription factor [Clostridium sp. CX1]|uniref:Stage 0 sporulation protein A homolog n=1 Tax=Clostridium tanneri TaxID=3037988 RepID=A0ABU4JWB4_9CLOT|nr:MULTISPECIES: response regulator transcription factor [unclassified Clostridium]MCT8976775.1 response regulator transcription factor [Clostridium sp. CX1]MDW8802392.1 response regulator transcription factor [Clostridium sp. A1-XYC3]